MMCVGRIGNRIDARWLILFGLSMTAYALHLMTEFTTFVPRKDIIVSGMIQGFGLGFVFIPLSTVSYVTLDPKYRAEAASLFSLIRNMGSSIGVSVAFTYFSRNARVQHAYLTEAVTPYSTWMNLDVSPDAVIPGSSTALQLLDFEMMRQAATIAYIGDFYLMMWVVLILVPCVFFMAGKPKLPAQPKAA
jgi:MFS transporter, DHA2 family, multidrug resistance protein